jgi:hypothetical protein
VGKDPEQLEREIELLRSQTDLVVQELERRLHDLSDVGVQAQRHPLAAYIFSFAAFSLVGLLLWLTLSRQHRW